MTDRTANLLGVARLLVADRLEATARAIFSHAGEPRAAVVVIGYGTSPSNGKLRRLFGLPHPGAVRLVDRLVADALVERCDAHGKRAVALYLTLRGQAVRAQRLQGRLAALPALLTPLCKAEQEAFATLLHKILAPRDTRDP